MEEIENAEAVEETSVVTLHFEPPSVMDEIEYAEAVEKASVVTSEPVSMHAETRNTNAMPFVESLSPSIFNATTAIEEYSCPVRVDCLPLCCTHDFGQESTPPLKRMRTDTGGQSAGTVCLLIPPSVSPETRVPFQFPLRLSLGIPFINNGSLQFSYMPRTH